MIVNKTSWHYRLNLALRSEYRMQWSLPGDLCSYWRMTIFSLLQVVAMLVILLTLLTVSVVFWKPILGSIVVVAGFVAIVSTLSFLGSKLVNFLFSRRAKPPGLVRQRYRAWRSRTCVKVTYE